MYNSKGDVLFSTGNYIELDERRKGSGFKLFTYELKAGE